MTMWPQDGTCNCRLLCDQQDNNKCNLLTLMFGKIRTTTSPTRTSFLNEETVFPMQASRSSKCYWIFLSRHSKCQEIRIPHTCHTLAGLCRWIQKSRLVASEKAMRPPAIIFTAAVSRLAIKKMNASLSDLMEKHLQRHWCKNRCQTNQRVGHTSFKFLD